MAEKTLSADSQPQAASSPDVDYSRSSSLRPSAPDSHGAQFLADKSAPTSAPFTGAGILKGTGPVINPISGRRQRPEVTYNLKELSHKTRLPSKSPSATATQHLPQQGDLTRNLWRPVAFENQKSSFNGRGQQTSDEQQPAKRQRIKEGTNSPSSLDQTPLWDTAVRSEGPAPPPVIFNQELINHVWPILLDGGVANPGDLLSLPFYKTFLCYPKKRDIEWNPATSCGRWSFRTKIDVVALLVQITGEHSPRCCNRCDPEIGLFKGCIVTTSETLAQNYYGCANCLYHGRQTFCTLKDLNRQRGTVDHVPQQSVSNSNMRTPGQKAEVSKVIMTATQAGTQRSSLDVIRNWAAFPRSSEIRPVVLSSSTTTKRHKESVSEPSEMLTMERWERAPGRIRSQVTATPESRCSHASARASELTACLDIAFSKSYLATGAEVQVCREAKFRVEIIRSGHTHQLKSEDHSLLICSVASAGKLNVKLEGEEPLLIGPHGMFTVRPCSACLVESEIYDDVALHITSVMTG